MSTSSHFKLILVFWSECCCRVRFFRQHYVIDLWPLAILHCLAQITDYLDWLHVYTLLFAKVYFLPRDWSPKFVTGLNIIIGCSSNSIWVIKPSFCQNDPLMGESFWQNNSLVTCILFELQPIIIFSPVANFGDQSLVSNENHDYRLLSFELDKW